MPPIPQPLRSKLPATFDPLPARTLSHAHRARKERLHDSAVLPFPKGRGSGVKGNKTSELLSVPVLRRASLFGSCRPPRSRSLCSLSFLLLDVKPEGKDPILERRPFCVTSS